MYFHMCTCMVCFTFLHDAENKLLGLVHTRSTLYHCSDPRVLTYKFLSFFCRCIMRLNGPARSCVSQSTPQTLHQSKFARPESRAKNHVTLPLPRGRTRFCFSNRYVAFEKAPPSVKMLLVGLFPSRRSPPPPLSPLSLPQVPVLTVTSVLPGHAPRGLIAARHLLTEINFSFRCLSFGFLSAKKPQDVVVCYP